MKTERKYSTKISAELFFSFSFFWILSFSSLYFLYLNDKVFYTLSIILFTVPIIFINYNRIIITNNLLIIETYNFIRFKTKKIEFNKSEIKNINFYPSKQNPLGVVLTGVKSNIESFLEIETASNKQHIPLNYCIEKEINEVINSIKIKI